MIALIDGDPLLYQAYWHIKKDYNNAVKKLSDEFNEGEYSEEEYIYKRDLLDFDYNKNGFKKAKKNIMKLLKDILEANFTEEYAMAIGGPNNFRSDLYPPYKQSSTRGAVRNDKPEWFEQLKTFLAYADGSVVTDGYEADDLLRIWAIECKNQGKEYVICSIDKDLDCIEGLHYVNIRQGKGAHHYTIEEDYANRFYWKQVLMGDNIDNIPGIKGCGPKSADKILDAVEPEDYEKAVCRAYHKAYKEDGYEHLILNGRLIHIWRFMNDHFKISKEAYDGYILSLSHNVSN